MMLSRIGQIAALFLKLGIIGFGGPAVHIASMEEEVVQRRRWLTHERFLDLVGATNLIPGPNSTEMAIHIGYVHAGFWGLVVAGVSFITPAVLITAGIAWVYVEYGQVLAMTQVMDGIQPAVLAIIVSAGWRLAAKALKNRVAVAVAVAVAASSLLLPVREVLILLVGSLLGTLCSAWSDGPSSRGHAGGDTKVALPLMLTLSAWWQRAAQAAGNSGLLVSSALAATQAPASLVPLALFFLKVGAVLYGTGYVLIAYLEDELIDHYHWLNADQLIDAIAIGQFTPGPILSTATFIGYVVMAQDGNHTAGLAGAAVATLGIFLPSFVFVAASGPFIPKLRASRLAGAFLDAVNAASMGLMAAVSLRLAQQTLLLQTMGDGGPVYRLHFWRLLVALVATILALRWRVSPAWLVVGGGVAGALVSLWR